MQQCINIVRFIANTGKDRNICVSRQTWLAPMQHRDSADEAERPAQARAEILYFLRGIEQSISRCHGVAIWQTGAAFRSGRTTFRGLYRVATIPRVQTYPKRHRAVPAANSSQAHVALRPQAHDRFAPIARPGVAERCSQARLEKQGFWIAYLSIVGQKRAETIEFPMTPSTQKRLRPT